MYAIVSDIHGNYPAFTAVLRDAKAQGAEQLLLLGDYTNCYPFQNEVVETLRCLSNVTAIRGNHEDYLIYIHATAPAKRTRKSFMPLYWSYNRHTPENYAFITELPETAQLSDVCGTIHLAHEVQKFIPSPVLYLGPSAYADLMHKKPFTFEEFLTRAYEWILNSPNTINALRALPMGVYLFGHSHIPLHIEFEGRLLINPGSCGFTSDFDTRAEYALLDRAPLDGGGFTWRVTQRRVEYDMDKVIEAIHESDFPEKLSEWHEVFLEQLLRGNDAFSRYVHGAGSR